MNADPSVQLRLLDLQAVDTALAQLAHRRRTLPELAALSASEQAVANADTDLVDAQTAVADIELEQQRLEKDVETVRTRATRDESRLQAGGLPARELEQLQHEIATLARRQSTLEDELLEVMERAETAERTLTESTTTYEAAIAERARLEAKRDEAFTEIDAAVAEREPQRNALAAELPAELIGLYEKARAHGGAGAALLRQRRCEACRIELSGSELARVRAAEPDTVVRCDNCRAVLIRTAESGL